MWGWKVLIEQLLLVTLLRQKRLQVLFLRFRFRFWFWFLFRVPFPFPAPVPGSRFQIPAFPYAHAKYWLAEMTLVICLPLAHASTCFSMFVYIRTHFPFALIGGNLTAQSTGELEAEFKFQRRSCKLSFLFPLHRQSAPKSLLAGY